MTNQLFPPSFPFAVAQVLGYPVFLGSMTEAVEALLSLRKTATKPLQVATLNPEMMMRGEADPAFAALLKAADLPLPDGAGVVWALKRQGISQPRLAGIEFAEALLQTLALEQGKVALVGAKPHVLQAVEALLPQRYPGLQVVLAQDGFYPQGEEPLLLERLQQATPDLILVALGVPRQESWIAQAKAFLPAGTLLIGVGGSFDVWSGTLERAPGWMRTLHLEWLWRFWLEPWRIQRSVPPLLRFLGRVIFNP